MPPGRPPRPWTKVKELADEGDFIMRVLVAAVKVAATEWNISAEQAYDRLCQEVADQ